MLLNYNLLFIYLRKKEKLNWGRLKLTSPGHKFYKRDPVCILAKLTFMLILTYTECIDPILNRPAEHLEN